MEKSHPLQEKKANITDPNLMSNTNTVSKVKVRETRKSFDVKCNTTISCRETFELHSLQNLIIIDNNEDSRLELTQFIENKYTNVFHINTFSNIVQALLHVNQNTSIFMFNCNYFDKASPKITRFVKNRNNKTLVISQFDTKKTAATIDSFIKKRFHNIEAKTAMDMEINASGLKQVVFPFRFSKTQHGARKNYHYMIVLLLIAAALFLFNR